jgi:hypothetical protein
MKAPTVTVKKFDPVPAGNHVARVYRIIQIGTITEQVEGKEKEMYKVSIGFELPNETKVFKEGQEAQPYVVSREYTFSMNEKANLRKMVEGMLGVSLTDEEAEGFDLTDILGRACLLNVVHKKSATGNMYALIQGAAPIPKGMEVPAAVNPTLVLDYDNWSQEAFDSLSPFVKDKIMSSKEFRAKFAPAPVDGVAPDDIPF